MRDSNDPKIYTYKQDVSKATHTKYAEKVMALRKYKKKQDHVCTETKEHRMHSVQTQPLQL